MTVSRAIAVTVGEHEFAWSSDDFARVQALIFQRAGISLNAGKHAMVYSRLSRRLRETGHHSFCCYLDWLESEQSPEEWQEFVNALTTNLTMFFREPHHFDVLARLLHKYPQRPWHIWCSAASTGEEPYSIVMTMLENVEPNVKFQLTASDIDSRVLATAARGIYRREDVKNLGQERLRRFFLCGKKNNEGLVCIKPEVRGAIEFLSVNLICDDWPFDQNFDIVFCRNVLIYFDIETKRRVLGRIHRVLKPGGLLFVGHAENLSDARDLFVQRGKTVYQRL